MGTFIRGAGDLRLGARPAGASVTASLLIGLVSYWKLDEVSGTRADSLGTNNLTDVNTVASATGKISLAASFINGNNEALARTVALGYTGSLGVSIAGWIKMDPTGGGAYDVVWGTAPGYAAGQIHIARQNAIGLRFTTNTENAVAAIEPGVTADNAWHFFVAWYDPAGPTNFIQVDNGTVRNGTVGAAGAPVDAIKDTYLGAYGGGSFWYNGLIDEIGLWNKVVSSTERTLLFNSGAGRTYPFA